MRPNHALARQAERLGLQSQTKTQREKFTEKHMQQKIGEVKVDLEEFLQKKVQGESGATSGFSS